MLITSFKDELALVTGATGGIGKATCIALAEHGCSVAVHYNTAVDTANDLVKQLKAKGVRAAAFGADMSNYDEVRQLHSDVTRSLGEPTILYNNAGLTLGKHGLTSAEQISIEQFEQTWRANCGSACRHSFDGVGRSCLAMEKRGWGRIIFCSSVAGFTGGVVGPHYASSKSALHGLIHWLSQVYCKKGITVNGVAPALIQDTKMLPGENEELAKKIPVGFLGKPDEVAETVMWMVKTGYVTNKVVGIDGGLFVQ